MRAFQRREAGKENYYKIASWDHLNGCWKDGKRQYDTEEEAMASVAKPGMYRVSLVTAECRKDLESFEI